jgi:hypothetical protein
VEEAFPGAEIRLEQGGVVVPINRSTYLSSEPVLPIKPFYLSNRSTYQTVLPFNYLVAKFAFTFDSCAAPTYNRVDRRYTSYGKTRKPSLFGRFFHGKDHARTYELPRGKRGFAKTSWGWVRKNLF